MDRRSLPLAVGLVVCTVIAAGAWVRVKLHAPALVDVRGSAKKRITSDFAEWTAHVSAEKKDRVEAYRALKHDVEDVQAFLKARGVQDSEQRGSAVQVNEMRHEETVALNGKPVQKSIFDGWKATQAIKVSSNNVSRVEQLSREATQLLEKGISIQSEAPLYHYTKLGELKVQMLAEASSDARQRAERMLAAAGQGVSVGRVVGLDTGVVNINAANSTETSWEGNYDTSSFEKDIITTVRVKFEVKN